MALIVVFVSVILAVSIENAARAGSSLVDHSVVHIERVSLLGARRR